MSTRILVVNDTEEILNLFRQILEEEGYEVLLYSYAIHDLKEIERLKPDLIIIDFLIGEQKEGWQMLQKLKMYRATATIPLIACTAAVRLVREMEGYLLSKGVTVVLKPFDIDDLLSAVQQALQSHPSIASIVDKEERDSGTE